MRQLTVKASVGKIQVDEIDMDPEESIPLYDSVKRRQTFAKGFVQFYLGINARMCQLTACASSLIHYMADEMGQDNMIKMKSEEKKEFIDFINSNNELKNYNMSTVNNAIQELKKMKMILPVRMGYFQLNPAYFFKSNNGKARIELIKELMKEGKL